MMRKEKKFAAIIMQCAQLAAALEVSAWPKPGNVHRTADYIDTKFEHFIAGSIALGPTIQKAAERGMTIRYQRSNMKRIEIGHFIKEAIEEVRTWHHGGNTHLGISLLFVPLALAAGFSIDDNGQIKPDILRRNVQEIMESTTIEDATHVYEAIALASSAALGRLRHADLPDLSEKGTKNIIQKNQLTLYDLMKASSRWDNISREWTSGMEICFTTGYPTLITLFNETHNLNLAIVHTFLIILSRFPDTFIARKIGVKHTPFIEEAVRIGINATQWISENAEAILMVGGLKTDEGTRQLWDFDKELRKARGELNPGTTADLTAGSLMIALLCGLRY